MAGSTNPRIYVACLASYNNGVLHGEWIDAAQDADAIQTEVNEILRTSKFPNVKVTCPECDGITPAPPDGHCEMCGDTGEVPSAEEWAIHDYEGFYGIKLGEYASFECVTKLAEAIEEHGEAIAIFFANDTSLDPDELVSRFEEAYRGEWDNLEDYAADYIEQTGMLDNVNKSVKNYFDYEAFARDLELGGDIWSERDSNHKLHVFDNNV